MSPVGQQIRDKTPFKLKLNVLIIEKIIPIS